MEGNFSSRMYGRFIGCPFPRQLHTASTSGDTAELLMSHENGIS
jgi:hypothetical protein